MKQSIRFFSIGLLTASLVLLGFYYLLDDSKASVRNVPVEDMIAEIESNGHRVITEKEFISYTLNNETREDTDEKDAKDNKDNKQEKSSNKKTADNKKSSSKDKKKNNKKDNKKKEDDNDDVIKAKFTTKDGVVTQEVADILVDEKIIKDRQKFLKYLDDNGYSEYLQVGTFEVSSDMSMQEIAEVITTYPGN